MKDSSRLLWILVGIIFGVVMAGLYAGAIQPALAAGDRCEDYVICTGAVALYPQSQIDGVWLLDSRNGKLLATIIDRERGKIVGWAELDLLNEFNISPRQGPHFLMTTGQITHGQAALYIAETVSGKFGMYTMGPRMDAHPGVLIHRHDLTVFRQPAQKG